MALLTKFCERTIEVLDFSVEFTTRFVQAVATLRYLGRKPWCLQRAPTWNELVRPARRSEVIHGAYAAYNFATALFDETESFIIHGIDFLK
jgi:hypothetical protein